MTRKRKLIKRITNKLWLRYDETISFEKLFYLRRLLVILARLKKFNHTDWCRFNWINARINEIISESIINRSARSEQLCEDRLKGSNVIRFKKK